MTGSIITATADDSLVVVGHAGVVQLPAVLLLAADRVMRAAEVNGDSLTMYPVTDAWHACLGTKAVNGATPWEALRKLADVIEGRT